MLRRDVEIADLIVSPGYVAIHTVVTLEIARFRDEAALTREQTQELIEVLQEALS